MAYCLGTTWNAAFWWVLVAGLFGNLADSLLGAALERRRYLNNDGVNSLNTLVGALTTYALYALFGK